MEAREARKIADKALKIRSNRRLPDVIDSVKKAAIMGTYACMVLGLTRRDIEILREFGYEIKKSIATSCGITKTWFTVVWDKAK